MEGKVINVTEANLYLLSEAVKDDLTVGDRVVRLEGSFGVLYSKVLLPKDSTLDPITLAKMDLQYHETFEALVNL